VNLKISGTCAKRINQQRLPFWIDSLIKRWNIFRKHSAPAEKLSVRLAEFETYIRNNRESIPNFGELYRQGEKIQRRRSSNRQSTKW
jgi:hypothetical protein